MSEELADAPVTGRWKRRTIIAASVVAAVTLVGVSAQQIGLARDRARWQPDQLVQVGEHALNVRCSGPKSDVTVVLESGSGGSSLDWAWVQDDLDADHRVCSYDRAGRGWSTGATPRDLADVSSDLHTALNALGEPGPYVLAGHSFGGLYARAFQQRYPADVAALALIDASHPGEEALLGRLSSSGGGIGFARALAPVGLFRLYLATGGSLGFETLPADAAKELRALWNTPGHLASISDENAAAGALRVQAARSLGAVGDVPTLVVSADEELFDGWATLQADLRTIGESVTAHTVPGSTHQSLLWEADHAELVAAHLRELTTSL